MRFAKYQVWKIEKPMLTTLIRAEAAWAFIKSFLISIYFGSLTISPLTGPGSFPYPLSASNSFIFRPVVVTHGFTTNPFKPTKQELAIKTLP